MTSHTFRAALIVSALFSGGIALMTGCKPALVERTPTERLVDERISEAVRAALGNSPSFKYPDVQVTSYNGKVQLSGFVVSTDQKTSAEAITSGVPGVVSVENRISLKK